MTNVTDEPYPVAGNSSLTTASGYAEIVYARPRTYFVRICSIFDRDSADSANVLRLRLPWASSSRY